MSPNNRMEYVTIVGDSFEEVAEECRAQGLSEKQFSIVAPINRHRLTTAGAEARDVVVATYARPAQA